MCDELANLLKPAVEETDEEKEEQKKAEHTFVAADPDDYDDNGEYEGDDEEYEDEDRYCIETDDFNIVANAVTVFRAYLHRIENILQRDREEQPILTINDFGEVCQAMQSLRQETLPSRNLACDYDER